jgi:hypothetical protein
LGLAHPRVALAFNSLLKEYAGAQIGGKNELLYFLKIINNTDQKHLT